MLEVEILAGKSCEVSRRTVKSWNKADWNSIRRETAEVPWRAILDQGTVQEAWDIFKNHICRIPCEKIRADAHIE
jgi:hypothetical protein